MWHHLDGHLLFINHVPGMAYSLLPFWATVSYFFISLPGGSDFWMSSLKLLCHLQFPASSSKCTVAAYTFTSSAGVHKEGRTNTGVTLAFKFFPYLAGQFFPLPGFRLMLPGLVQAAGENFMTVFHTVRK